MEKPKEFIKVMKRIKEEWPIKYGKLEVINIVHPTVEKPELIVSSPYLIGHSSLILFITLINMRAIMFGLVICLNLKLQKIRYNNVII